MSQIDLKRLRKPPGVGPSDIPRADGAWGSAPKATRTGSVTFALLELAKSVTFATPMPSANYRLALQPTSNLSATFWPSSKTASGFTANVSVSISGTVDYMAIED